jgi:hypothetical protein
VSYSKSPDAAFEKPIEALLLLKCAWEYTIAFGRE